MYICWNYEQQECIPVGCVPAARRPYAGVCFQGGCLLPVGLLGGGRFCLFRGVCLVWGVSAPGECVCSRGGVCSLGGSACSGEWGVVCLLQGCVSAPGGCIPACTEADTLPPVDRILDTRLWKYYLGPTSLWPVKNLRMFNNSKVIFWGDYLFTLMDSDKTANFNLE